MRKKCQRKECKSNHKFEVVGGQELLVRVPLPLAEVSQVVGIGLVRFTSVWRDTGSLNRIRIIESAFISCVSEDAGFSRRGSEYRSASDELLP